MIDYREVLLFISVILVLYNYVLYPAALILIDKLYSKKLKVSSVDNLTLPKVSFIIAAFNEEKVIEHKISNTLDIDYPEDKLQVIVVSDGSTDKTPGIVNKYIGVIGLYSAERQGKSAALNRGVDASNGEIIVFSDANNDYSKDSLKHLVRHFSDKQIGAVTGSKHIYTDSDRESTVGDGLYWRYESIIKKAESNLGSITAADGEILAIRRSLFKPIDASLINDDAAITFDLVKRGYRVIYDENAKAYEKASIDLADDFNVKVRMAAGGFQTLFREKHYLFPPKDGFSFKFISHKILRWIVPHLLIVIFICTALLSESLSYLIFFILQLVFYLTSVGGWFLRKRLKLPNIVYIPMYFTFMNVALFTGFIKYLGGKQMVQWKKAVR